VLIRDGLASAFVPDTRGTGEVEGAVAPGFEAVREAFWDNVSFRGDTGASCAVYVRGELVVDLWTSTAEEQPWTPDMRTCVFSASKGVTTVCVLMAAERGLLSLDAPVTAYWPEFGASGKGRTTLRQLLAHRAGLVAPEIDLTVDDLRLWAPAADVLAAQAPAWAPGTAYAYHAMTFGWLAGEVLRRATGLRPSQWLQTYITEPLGLAMTYGADESSDDVRPMLAPLPSTDIRAAAALAHHLLDPLVLRSLSLGGVLDPADLCRSFNRPELLASELPAANLVTNARSLARLYAATVGTVDGVRLLAPETVDDASQVQSQGRPLVGPDEGHRWGTGFMVASQRRQMAGDGSFGHDGAGGQVAFAHPRHGIGFGYQTSRPGGIPDERAEELCRALRTCL
jgi:CubicO group peptidase (beta-lactamase class C family)